MRIALQHRAAMAVLITVGLTPLAVADEYPRHARISYDAGGSMVRGANDNDWSHATVNTLILPGDTLWVEKGGASELELAGGAFLRMADGSKAEITALPPNGTVRGWQGSFYVQRMSRSTGSVAFVSPACSAVIEPDTCVRFDVVDVGATTISVRWGRVTVNTDAGGAEMITENRRCWVDPGYLPSEPQPFDRTAEDSFDVWNRERTQFLAGGGKSTPKTVVIQESALGASDLDGSGEWIYLEDRYYWRPTVVVNYIPYRSGYWSYVPGCGSVWVDQYPFAYVTSHYGRWHYTPAYGWLWAYDPVWSPAWAATIRCGDYFVWTPVDFYSRPVMMYQSACFNVGGVQFCVGASSYASSAYVYNNPFYVYPIYDNVVHYIGMNHTEINIWNININQRPHVRVPYDRSVATVRDYAPPRSIRGPEYYREGGRPARESIHTLEQSVGRAQFASVDRTGGRGQRTTEATQGRMARMRSVRMDAKDAQTVGSAAVRGRGTETASRRDTGAAAPETSRDTHRDIRRMDSPSNGAARSDLRTSRIPGLERGKAEAVQSVRNQPQRSGMDTRRTPTARLDMDVPQPAPTRKPSETRTPPRDTGSNAAPRPSGITNPARGTDAPTRTPVPERSSIRSNPGNMPAPSRGEIRSNPGSMPAPSRSVIRSAPRNEAVPSQSIIRSAPRMEEAAPRAIERSAPTFEPTPSRDAGSFRAEPRVAPSMPAPERHEIRNAPTPAPARSFDMPQRNAAPEPRPSRSFSAPTPSRPSSSSDSGRGVRGGGASRR